MAVTSTRPLRVFLCHASVDKPKVRELYQRLVAEGWIEPWLDVTKLLPGLHWTTVIKQALDEADSVIIFISNNSINREGFVQRELNYAWELSLGKPRQTIYLIPIRLEECDVPYDLRERQWADYFGRKKEETYQALLQSLRLRLEQKLMIEADEIARQERMARKARERTEREKAEREVKERAQREKAEREAAEKAMLENAEREARMKAEREKTEREAKEIERAQREKAEREAAEKAALEKAEREAREKAESEKIEREAMYEAARQKAEREKLQQEVGRHIEKREASSLKKKKGVFNEIVGDFLELGRWIINSFLQSVSALSRKIAIFTQKYLKPALFFFIDNRFVDSNLLDLDLATWWMERAFIYDPQVYIYTNKYSV